MTMLSSKQGDTFAAYQQLQTTASSADATTAAATASPEEPASQLAAPLQSDASLVIVEAPDLNSSPRDVPHGASNAISANGAVGDPVMISYRVPETGATELGGDGTVVRLADSLRAMGIGCFVGESALQPGQKWALNIQEAVKECKVFVVLCSPSYGDTPWTYREIQLADNNKKPLLAVWHSGTYPPPKVEIWLGGEQRLPRGHHPMTHPSVNFDDIVVELLSALERFGVKPTL
uniref:TIR domain-containing protein n=1 Tax=Mantoniella antarctica TaxID=81844 RepID=A0A7S0SH84_9CHLO|mmetsp:Transcript_21358/g.52754  ORF Transcript_21358/g.52754 Transcript_21358/m.52754 type:complete len:234 (+) Transcript_21358:586-1287(+)